MSRTLFSWWRSSRKLRKSFERAAAKGELDHDGVLEYLRRVRHSYRQGVPSFFRAEVLRLIRQYRPTYKVNEDWIVNRNSYEVYQRQKPINDANLLMKGDWVTVISMRYPSKGKRYAEYHSYSGYIGASLPEMATGQVTRIYSSEDVELSNVPHSYNVRQIRYATSAEIERATEWVLEQELKKNLKNAFKATE